MLSLKQCLGVCHLPSRTSTRQCTNYKELLNNIQLLSNSKVNLLKVVSHCFLSRRIQPLTHSHSKLRLCHSCASQTWPACYSRWFLSRRRNSIRAVSLELRALADTLLPPQTLKVKNNSKMWLQVALLPLPPLVVKS